MLQYIKIIKWIVAVFDIWESFMTQKPHHCVADDTFTFESYERQLKNVEKKFGNAFKINKEWFRDRQKTRQVRKNILNDCLVSFFFCETSSLPFSVLTTLQVDVQHSTSSDWSLNENGKFSLHSFSHFLFFFSSLSPRWMDENINIHQRWQQSKHSFKRARWRLAPRRNHNQAFAQRQVRVHPAIRYPATGQIRPTFPSVAPRTRQRVFIQILVSVDSSRCDEWKVRSISRLREWLGEFEMFLRSGRERRQIVCQSRKWKN